MLCNNTYQLICLTQILLNTTFSRTKSSVNQGVGVCTGLKDWDSTDSSASNVDVQTVNIQNLPKFACNFISVTK